MSAAMLYLKDNYFLEEELSADHIKSRILGHWGTVPGQTFIYGALNYLAKTRNQSTLLVDGPGHGAPAIIAALWLEKTLAEFDPEARLDKEGMAHLIKQFSWPGGYPSHTYPGLPGSIHEGGELGYALGTAYGAAFDNPELLVGAIIGDGEAETGPLAASWHSGKFINPRTSGAVLPILHLNGYRISGPTIFGSMSDNEIRDYFYGLSYEPLIVDQYNCEDVYRDMLIAVEDAYEKIMHIKSFWDPGEKILWPMIVLKSMKGWTCPDDHCGVKLQDHNNSHGIPLKHPKDDPGELATLTNWLKSYMIEELLGESGKPKPELFDFIPSGDLRIGKNKHSFGGDMMKPLELPRIEDHAVRVVERGNRIESNMFNVGQYLRDVFRLNEEHDNFRMFSPDETESNMLSAVYQATGRGYMWPIREQDHEIDPNGRIMEILSEHVLQEWYQGYNLTGRHGIFASYEAFLGITTNQIEQYLKFIRQSLEFSWRKPVPGMNYISTSTAWRQEHNGFSHQNPTLINALLTKHSDLVNIYFPSDVNTLIATLDKTFRSTNCVNLIIVAKRGMQQWLSMDEATAHVRKGISTWSWADSVHSQDIPDVVLASAGDYQTTETLAAAQILNELVPEIRIRYVNVNEITALGIGDKDDLVDTEKEFMQYFTDDRDVIFNFHGYPEAIKQLTWGHEVSMRMKVLGYIEQGTTTTPFDMQVQNRASRYHVAIHAVRAAAKWNPIVKERKMELINHFEEILMRHSGYIKEHGVDMDEVKGFEFKVA